MDGLSRNVTVSVQWTKTGPTPTGTITYNATIKAKNPSKRAVQVTVTDVVSGVKADNSKVVVDTRTFAPVTVGAGQEVVVGTISNLAISGAYKAIFDEATGQYYDLDLGVDIEPDNVATNTATVTTGTVTNGTVVVSDVENITSGFKFSVTSTTDASGFTNGVLPTNVTTATWSKQVSASGSVSFTKSVTPTAGLVVTGGSLSDIATVSTLAGAELSRATASTTLNASKLVDLTVTKRTPDVFEGSQSATFTFQLFAGATATGTPITSQNVVVNTSTPLDAGKRVSTITFPNLAPGQYTVREVPVTNWVTQPDQTIDLGSAEVGCTAGLTFVNALTNLQGQNLTVTKSANPSFKRAYAWTISKDVDKTKVSIASGGQATFNYTVGVKRTTTDSDFAVGGTISVTNPNAFAVPVNSLVDQIQNGQTCSLVSPPSFPVSLAGGATLNVGYTCTGSAAGPPPPARGPTPPRRHGPSR